LVYSQIVLILSTLIYLADKLMWLKHIQVIVAQT